MKLPPYVVEVNGPSGRGRGVLAGELILTAAHCVNFDTTGGMAMGGHRLEEVKTHTGTFLASPIFVDPVSDIAALSSPDDQEFFNDAEAYQSFVEQTKAAELASAEIAVGSPIPVQLLNKDGNWVSGTARAHRDWQPTIHLRLESESKGGSSGGPIINAQGKLFGIVSHCVSTPINGFFDGACACVQIALPEWILRQLR